MIPDGLVNRGAINKKSVRGSIVLRREYVRGSTLFAVWNLSTSDEEARKGLIKLSYWFAP